MQLSLWTSSSSGALAKASRLLESGRDWMTRVATWPSSAFKLLTEYGPTGWFSRTSPDSCRQTNGGILEPSSGHWGNAGMGSPTEFLTLNLPEFHNAAAVSSLSDILETGDVPRRYYLSPKACAGILHRAEKRGKVLPDQLHLALMAVAATGTMPTPPTI